MNNQRETIIDLSIVIPHYNDYERVVKLVESIPLKNNIEIIIVDDNSSDEVKSNLQNYIDECRDRNIFFFVNPSMEHSAGACRNIGLTKAIGKWILFADADDYFTDVMYESVRKYFDSIYDIIFFNVDSVNLETGARSDRHINNSNSINAYISNRSRKNELDLRTMVPPWGKLIRRQIIVDNNIQFEEIRYSNDVMFSTIVGQIAKTIHADNTIIYIITDGSGSLTKIKNIESFDIRKRALIRRYIYWYKHLSRKEIKLLKMNFYGLRFVLTPIKNFKNYRLAKEYYRLLKYHKIPLFFI